MKKQFAFVFASTVVLSAHAGAEVRPETYQLFTAKVGGSRFHSQVASVGDYELVGRSLSLEYSRMTSIWTEENDVYLGVSFSGDIHYNSKKKSDTPSLYEVEEISSLVLNVAPKITHSLTDRIDIYGAAGLSYGYVEALEYKKTLTVDKDSKPKAKGAGYMWAIGSSYRLHNNFEFGAELRGNKLALKKVDKKGDANLYAFYVTMGYEF
ncbi:porin family protein [Vibrio sp. S9_S30]|uniref:outer membrane beta-barrel protein n=1 Tax=Vibrio sp. S9_S30 TaxID=2720226 RepID=UPI001681305B|nr:outer membrane beta-barrel protein [Vibrio sp. S9_S30]MBD1558682.1 porin family protein [Vibrio sp. S9_S30]